MMEAFALIESISGKPMNYVYSDNAREGDHIVYFSDLHKMQLYYPNWQITRDLKTIFQKVHYSLHERDNVLI